MSAFDETDAPNIFSLWFRRLKKLLDDGDTHPDSATSFLLLHDGRVIQLSLASDQHNSGLFPLGY